MEEKKISVENLFEKWNRFKKWVPLILALLIVIFIVGMVFTTMDYIKNFADRIVHFNKPKQYIEAVETRQIEKDAEFLSVLYEKYMLPNMAGVSDRNASLELETNFGETGRKMLSDTSKSMQRDFTFLKDAKITADANSKNQILGVTFETALEKKCVFSVEMTADAVEGDIYYYFPQLSERYLVLEKGSEGGMIRFGTIEENLSELLMVSKLQDLMRIYKCDEENQKSLEEALPSKELVKQMLVRYMTSALRQTKQVKKIGTEVVEADGIKEKATRYDVIIDRQTAIDIHKSVLYDMADDKELREIIIGVTEAMDQTADGYEVYAKFKEKLENYAEQAEKEVKLNQDMIISLYVNAKGEIISRRIAENEDSYIEYRLLDKGRNAGFALEKYSYGTKETVEGSGIVTFGNFRGVYRLKRNDSPLVEGEILKCDLRQILKGNVNLKANARLAQGFAERDKELYSVWENTVAHMTIKIEKNRTLAEAVLKENDGKIGSLSMNLQLKKGKKMTVPAGKKAAYISDTQDLEKWLDEAEWEKYITTLKKADAPISWIDWIDRAVRERNAGKIVVF